MHLAAPLARAVAGPVHRRAWVLEVELWFYVALAVMFATFANFRRTGGEGVPENGISIALAVVVAVLALVRWWRPDRAGVCAVVAVALGMAGALTYDVLGPYGVVVALVGPVPVALAVAVRRTRPAVAALAAAVALVVTASGLSLRAGGRDSPSARLDGGWTLPLTQLAILFLVWLVPLVVGLVQRGADARRRAAALARVRAAERLQVARELHDLVANHVTGMTTYAQAAGLRSDLPDEVRGMLDAIGASGDDALAAMRRMVGALRSIENDGLDDFDAMPTTATDLGGAVRSAVGETDAVAIRLAPELDPPRTDPPADVLATVHRVVVEALTNARRHAPDAREIVVALDLPRPDLLAVEVRNDGAGRPSKAGRRRGGGFGLVGLRERVGALGGTVEHGRAGDEHWSLRAELPWEASVPDTRRREPRPVADPRPQPRLT